MHRCLYRTAVEFVCLIIDSDSKTTKKARLHADD